MHAFAPASSSSCSPVASAAAAGAAAAAVAGAGPLAGAMDGPGPGAKFMGTGSPLGGVATVAFQLGDVPGAHWSEREQQMHPSKSDVPGLFMVITPP